MAQTRFGEFMVPEIGQTVTAEEACAVIESVKAASDVYAPVGGEIVEPIGHRGIAGGRVERQPYPLCTGVVVCYQFTDPCAAGLQGEP